jgi:hypothetical protein
MSALHRELQIKRWSRAKKWALALGATKELKTLARSRSSPQLKSFSPALLERLPKIISG